GPLARDHGRTARLKPMPWRRAAEQLKLTALAMLLLSTITLKVPDRSLKLLYLSRFSKVLFRKPLPAILFVYAMRAAMHYHGWKLSRLMAEERQALINSYGAAPQDSSSPGKAGGAPGGAVVWPGRLCPVCGGRLQSKNHGH